jgi:hypothetical protein
MPPEKHEDANQTRTSVSTDTDLNTNTPGLPYSYRSPSAFQTQFELAQLQEYHESCMETITKFHMDATNSIVWTRKSFIVSLVSCRVGFQPNCLGSKISDGSQLSAQFLGPPTATGT